MQSSGDQTVGRSRPRGLLYSECAICQFCSRSNDRKVPTLGGT